MMRQPVNCLKQNVEMFARVLLIETSGKPGRVALAEDGRVVDARVLSEARRHARDLALRVQEMLTARRWSPREISAVIVSVGPGSFTGLRVGIASAKAFAYATQCALFAVPTFDALALGVEPGDFSLSIVADGLQGMIYAGEYTWSTETSWRPRGPIALLAASDWVKRLQPGTHVGGTGLSVIKPLLTGKDSVVESASEVLPENLVQAAQARPDDYRTSAWSIEPIYLRGSSAEEKRKRTLESTSG